MIFNPPKNPCLKTAELLTIEYIKNKIKCLAKELKDQDGDNFTYMQARNEIIKSQGFKSEYHLNKYFSDLHTDVEGRLKSPIFRQCVRNKIKKNQRYFAFEASIGLTNDTELLIDRHLEVISVRTLVSTWVRYSGAEHPIEIRKADFANPKHFIMQSKAKKSSLLMITHLDELFGWFLVYGGTALIPEDLVKDDSYLSRWLTPYPNIEGWH